MKEEILLEFYNEYFYGAIPRKQDGRVRDYLTDVLPFYLRNLAKQEMVSLGHPLVGANNKYNQETEEELSRIVNALKDEMFFDTRERCESRSLRSYGTCDSATLERELNNEDFLMLSSMLDFYRKQLEGYLQICAKHGVTFGQSEERVEEVDIKTPIR